MDIEHIFLDGIIYRIWGVGGIIACLGVIITVFSITKKKPKGKYSCALGLFLLCAGLIISIYYCVHALSPDISVTEASYSGMNRDSRVAPPLPLTNKYYFQNNNGNITLWLDAISRRKILPDGFNPNNMYRIYYETDTRIILFVELIE